VIKEAERIAGRSLSFDSALEELAAILHRVALAQAGAPPEADDIDAARINAMATRLERGHVQVMYQVALLGRRDLSLAPDEYAGFTMALLRMLSFSQPSLEPRAAASSAAQRPAPAKVAAPSAGARVPAAPVATPMRSSEPAPAALAPPAIPFEGNWPAFVEKLGLTGMAGMVAPLLFTHIPTKKLTTLCFESIRCTARAVRLLD